MEDVMGIISSKCECDRCHLIFENLEENIDGFYFCNKCEILNEIECEKREIKKTIKWLKGTFINDIREKRKKIKQLEVDLKKMNGND